MPPPAGDGARGQRRPAAAVGAAHPPVRRRWTGDLGWRSIEEPREHANNEQPQARQACADNCHSELDGRPDYNIDTVHCIMRYVVEKEQLAD